MDEGDSSLLASVRRLYLWILSGQRHNVTQEAALRIHYHMVEVSDIASHMDCGYCRSLNIASPTPIPRGLNNCRICGQSEGVANPALIAQIGHVLLPNSGMHFWHLRLQPVVMSTSCVDAAYINRVIRIHF